MDLPAIGHPLITTSGALVLAVATAAEFAGAYAEARLPGWGSGGDRNRATRKRLRSR